MKRVNNKLSLSYPRFYGHLESGHNEYNVRVRVDAVWENKRSSWFGCYSRSLEKAKDMPLGALSTFSKYLFCLLITLTMTSLTTPSAVADEPFEVTREILIGDEHYLSSRALAQTKERGYVVAGGVHTPWAIRTDAEGNVQWRHVLPMKEWTPGGGDARYEGAATMADDSTLLCGYKDVGEKSRPLLVGMLTHIDKAGRMVSNRLLYPQGDQTFKLNYIRKCVPWDKGFAVIGQSTRWAGSAAPNPLEHFCWLLALDENGDIKWEKLISNIWCGIGTQILIMANQELVIATPNQITQLRTSGEIKSQRTIAVGVELVQSTVPDSLIRLFPIYNDPTSTLETLGERLDDVESVTGPGGIMVTNKAYLLPDHSLVLFGGQRVEGTSTATIAKLSADLSKKQFFFFKPFWISNSVHDALPTGRPGEFVTIRDVRRIPHWPDEKRWGPVMSFIRVK